MGDKRFRNGFVLIVVLFILLIIVGASSPVGYGPGGYGPGYVGGYDYWCW